MRDQIIVHHTASEASSGKDQIQGVNNYHRDKDWGGGARAKKSSLGWYVQYHYFIEPSGKVIQCAQDHELRWHAGNQNDRSLGICMAGYFDPGHDPGPTGAQISALKALLVQLSAKYGISPDRVVPHRKYSSKSCYGSLLSDSWASELIIKPTPMPTKLVHRIAVILTGHSEPIRQIAQAAYLAAQQWFDQATEAGLEVLIDFYTRDNIVWRTVKAPSATGPNYELVDAVFVDPQQIAAVGTELEKQSGKQYDVIFLSFNPDKVAGEKPTNPVHNPLYVEGFTIAQQSLPPTSDQRATQHFFIHEILHAWYFIINYEGQLAFKDDVHNHGSFDNPGPGNYKEIVQKLKPHWALLTGPWQNPPPAKPAPVPAKESSMIAFEYKGTVYVPVFAKFVPLADEDTFRELGGNWNSVKKLSDAEFESIVRPFLAQSSVLK